MVVAAQGELGMTAVFGAVKIGTNGAKYQILALFPILFAPDHSSVYCPLFSALKHPPYPPHASADPYAVQAWLEQIYTAGALLPISLCWPSLLEGGANILYVTDEYKIIEM